MVIKINYYIHTACSWYGACGLQNFSTITNQRIAVSQVINKEESPVWVTQLPYNGSSDKKKTHFYLVA